MNKRFHFTEENLKSFLKGLGFSLLQAASVYVLAVKEDYGLEASAGGLAVVMIANLVYQYTRSDK
jgi:hypothetical protein